MERRRSLYLLVLSIVFAGFNQNLFAQFGNLLGRGNAVALERQLPPAVNLENARIKLEVNSQVALQPQYKQTLQTKLTTTLQGDKRFVIDAQNPSTIVSLTVTNVVVSRNTVPATVAGKQVNVLRVTGNVQVSFQVVEVVTKKALDSTNLESVFDRSFVQAQPARLGGLGGLIGNAVAPGAPTDAQVLDQMVTDITARVTRRIVSTKETIPLQLPDGDLKSAQDKVKNKQWVSLYDDLDVMPPPRSPEGQAQRQYWMGIAKEAQAYESQNREDARKSLLTAVRHYQEAAKIQIDKPEYGDSSRRAEESIVLLAGPDASGGGASVATQPGGARTSAGRTGDALTNDHVIQMVKSGMDANLLLDIINDSKNSSFDLSPNGLVRLSQEKVPANVIQAMRKRASGQ